MFKVKMIFFASLIALGTWATASVLARVGSHTQGFVQIDTVDLMSKAGDLPVETAPAI